MTSYSFDAKDGKCLMIKPALVGRRNPETPSSGMDPRMPAATILGNLVAVFLTTVYWEHVLKLPADPRLVHVVFGVGLMPTLHLLAGTFLSKGDKEEIKGEIQTMGALVDFSDQITKIYRQGARAARLAFEQPRGGHHTFEQRAAEFTKIYQSRRWHGAGGISPPDTRQAAFSRRTAPATRCPAFRRASPWSYDGSHVGAGDLPLWIRFGHPAPVELGQGRVISDGPEDVRTKLHDR